jgi:hypothetical protein
MTASHIFGFQRNFTLANIISNALDFTIEGSPLPKSIWKALGTFKGLDKPEIWS